MSEYKNQSLSGKSAEVKEEEERNDGQKKNPSFNMLVQYVKDFSFENPGAPHFLGGDNRKISINIDINVNARSIGQTDYEVSLYLESKAERDADVVFSVELSYAGIFRLTNIPQESIQPLILVECPRLLFPFSRQIIADVTRNGGYPPLMIDPIDFGALYQQRVAEQEKETLAAEGNKIN